MAKQRVLVVAAVAMACSVLVGCSSTKVGISWDNTVDFSRYTTFAFRADRKLDSSYRQVRAEDVITADLEAKGFRPDATDPDLLVGLSPEVGPDVEGVPVDSGQLQWATWGPTDSLTISAGRGEPRVAGLVMSFRDGRSDRLIWRGAVEGLISVGEPKDIERKLVRALKGLLVKFPPGAK